MNLDALQRIQLRRALALVVQAQQILARLDGPPAPPIPASPQDQVTQWLNTHLIPAPGHRVRVDVVRRACLLDLGIKMTPQKFGTNCGLRRQRSNGRTYYLDVALP
jgi:hypothetical protein